MSKKELAVGDSTDLEIIFSTGTNVGKVSKRPAITTNEGPPGGHVGISTEVVRQPDSTYPIIINPYRLYVSKADTIEIDEAKFTIRNVSDQELGVKVIDAPYGYFRLDIHKSIKAGAAVDCKLKVNPEFLKDSFEKSVTIELADAAKTRFTIPVVRRLIGSQATQPAPTAPVTPPAPAKTIPPPPKHGGTN